MKNAQDRYTTASSELIFKTQAIQLMVAEHQKNNCQW